MNTDTDTARPNVFMRGLQRFAAKVHETPPPVSCGVLSISLVSAKLLLVPSLSWGFALFPAMLWLLLLVFQNYLTVVLSAAVFRGMTNYDQYQQMVDQIAQQNLSRMHTTGDDDDGTDHDLGNMPMPPTSGSIN
jgi:hypothetical protein